MRKLRGLMKVAVVSVLTAALVVLPSCGREEKERSEVSSAAAGVVVQVDGTFDIFSLSSNCWAVGGPGTPLFKSDRIWVEPGSSIMVLMSSGARLRANENSRFTVDTTGDEESGITVSRGELVLLTDSQGEKITVTSPEVTVVPAAKSAGGNSVSVTVEPGGRSIVDVYEGGAALKTGDGSLKAKSSRRYEVFAGEQPTADDQATTVRKPEENNSEFVDMLMQPYYQDEGKREEIEEEAVLQVKDGTQESWPYNALAQVMIDRRELDKAIGVLITVLEIDSHNPTALIARGNIELLQGKWGEAEDSFMNARRSDRKSIGPPLGIAQAFLGMGDLAGAEKWFKEVLNAEPEEVHALTGLGIVRILENKLDDASRDLEQVMALDPGNGTANMGMAVIELVRGDAAAAAGCMEAVVEEDPGKYETWTSLGMLEMKLGNTGRAEAAFRRLVGSEIGEYMSYGYQNHGVLDWMGGKVDDALEKWTKSVDLVSGRRPVMADIGIAYLAKAQFAAAGDQFAGLISMDALDWYPHRLLGEAFLYRGMYTEAIGECDSAVRDNGLDWSSKLMLGMSFLKSGNAGTGAREMKKARKNVTGGLTSADERYLLGYSYELEERFEAALEEYRKAQELFPEDGRYYYRAGLALAALGKKEDAEKEFRKALDAGLPYIPAAVELSRLMADAGDIEGATREIEAAIRRDGGNIELRIEVAAYLAGQEDYDGAIDHLEEARGVGGLDPATVAGLSVLEGSLRDDIKDYREAARLYETAVALDPARGDAWYYLAEGFERSGRVEEANGAYRQSYALCAQRPEWHELYEKAAARLNLLVE
ncbi:MAG: tetratricopeptide repeat protein [Actinobacteria bacterium]|nr:tetratricopeptide repeat protein [Actinomycetota bacterium]